MILNLLLRILFSKSISNSNLIYLMPAISIGYVADKLRLLRRRAFCKSCRILFRDHTWESLLLNKLMMIPFSWRLNPSSQYLSTSSHHLNLPPKVKILILLRFKSFLPKFTSFQTMFVERFIKDDCYFFWNLLFEKS